MSKCRNRLGLARGYLNVAGTAALVVAAILGGTLIAVAQGKKYGVGRQATPHEIAGWDIAVRPDGKGLPIGKGTPKDGEPLYMERCASCHGEFGEANGRWPMVAGGMDSLKSDDPQKTVGSYWPYASTLFDYIRRAMPFGNAQSLTPDELYALTAYVLYLNDIIKDENFELNERNFATIKMPNEANFYDDDRETAEKHFWKSEPCMKDCLPGKAEIIGRARVLDVTPDSNTRQRVD